MTDYEDTCQTFRRCGVKFTEEERDVKKCPRTIPSYSLPYEGLVKILCLESENGIGYSSFYTHLYFRADTGQYITHGCWE